ncbi:MAG: hydantoinase B/oxoprolinase family protein, partial [Minwuiales bacterium]|nr:hydantoinase B/oxoprolinase family protein [Minwuiales bacterium]
VRVALTVEGDRLTVDFTGSDPQMRGFKNSSLANTYSAVYMGLASFFEPDLPRNEGTFRNVDIIAPEGSVVNPRPPAPLTMCTVFIAHEIVHCIWKALAKADPTRSCAGWGKSVHGVTAGTAGNGNDKRGGNGGEPYVMYHWNSMPGGGAVEGRDGFNQIGHLIALGGLTLPNVETYEQLYPVRFVKQEFRCDAAGAGAFRGGTGIDYAVEVLEGAEYSFRGEGVGLPSGWGAAGGGTGAPGDMTLYPEDGDRFEAPPYGVRRFGPLRMTARSPGGGGFGDPKRRDPERVLRDVRDGVISRGKAAEIYGVIVSADGRSIEEPAR